MKDIAVKKLLNYSS